MVQIPTVAPRWRRSAKRPQIKSATVGYNVNEGDVFHVCIDSVFDSLDDLNTYIDHPEHQKVRAFMNEVSYDKTVFDYEF